MALLLLSVAGFPSSCSSAHFWTVASENGAEKTQQFGKNIKIVFTKYLRSFEVVFDVCEKG